VLEQREIGSVEEENAAMFTRCRIKAERPRGSILFVLGHRHLEFDSLGTGGLRS